MSLRRNALTLALALLAAPCWSQETATIESRTRPTLCAEVDNVDLRLSGDVRRLTVEARHPAAIGAIVEDRYAPDFTNCVDMADGPPDHAFAPRRVTLYETLEWQLVGLTFDRFWRAAAPPVTVAGRTERGLHLLQLWTRVDERAEEALVLYPADGYWRLRPLPPRRLGWTAYGASVLLGPIEDARRPIVDIAAVAFDPQRRAFRVSFVRGGGMEVVLAALDRERIAVDVAFDAPIAPGPFAGLRSMYVREDNADTARLAWRAPGDARWREAPVMDFERAQAIELWAGRHVISRHNSSAPDISFGSFSR